MSEITNIVMCGVGGQGVLLASELIIEVARVNGFEVRKSEVHGMAQRGGAVSSHVRFGRDVFSPLIPEYAADFIMSFEYMEALRYTNMVNKSTKIYLNAHKLVPTTVMMGGPAYPENIEAELLPMTESVYTVPALNFAQELGNGRAENVVLLGAVAPKLPFDKDSWAEVMKRNLKPKLVDLNLIAFEKGYNFGTTL
ncbi:MAG: indolepyruvate oxidoreductase subunit beta [Planctomycetes bacterium]|nr:indolepyruvate oxidoreductase subunit beta [Planctomycetota bacterium]